MKRFRTIETPNEQRRGIEVIISTDPKTICVEFDIPTDVIEDKDQRARAVEDAINAFAKAIFDKANEADLKELMFRKVD